jgi:hypothetical protein
MCSCSPATEYLPGQYRRVAAAVCVCVACCYAEYGACLTITDSYGSIPIQVRGMDRNCDTLGLKKRNIKQPLMTLPFGTPCYATSLAGTMLAEFLYGVYAI